MRVVDGEVFDVDPDLIKRPKVPAELPHGLRVTNLYVEYEVLCDRCSIEG